MASPPLTYLERQWASGVGNNNLLDGAVQSSDRRYIQNLDRDFHRSITPQGRRTLLTLGRWLYWNVSAVRGCINEMAELCVQQFMPQFDGADQAWGQQVGGWMIEHDKICDVRGWPFTMGTFRENLVRTILVDGDQATLLTQTPEEYPMLQVFPSHRIGSQFGTMLVEGGPYNGMRITDGIISNDFGRVVAYRVLKEQAAYNYFEYDEVPARDMFLSYLPEWPDQLRGVSLLGASCFDWQDAADARRFKLLSDKLASSIALIETNEAGEADRSKKLINRSSANFNSDGSLATTATETIDGISVRYFRSGSGSKLESHRHDNPTANQAAFRDDVIREAIHGMGWSVDYSLNPTKVGGAPMRVIVDRLNRKLDSLRTKAVIPTQSRIDGYRVAKVMDSPGRSKGTVLFPFNPDWWRWSYHGPAVLTADAKYNSDVNLQERRSGNKTLAESTAESGSYWRDIRQQRQVEADDLLTRATELSKKFSITIDAAISILEKMDSAPAPLAAEPEPAQSQAFP